MAGEPQVLSHTAAFPMTGPQTIFCSFQIISNLFLVTNAVSALLLLLLILRSISTDQGIFSDCLLWYLLKLPSISLLRTSLISVSPEHSIVKLFFSDFLY